MAQNITLQGAQYSDVPAVELPKTGGGTASFTDVSDTTAAASDVASGKYFYTSAGVKTAGTASGGGGASNIVQGTFTTSSTTGAASQFTIPYTGSGYPIALFIYIDGGMYNNTTSGNTTWYNLIQRYVVGAWYMTKSRTTEEPTYSNTTATNQGVVETVYKNSTSSATTYNHAGSRTQHCYRNQSSGTASGNSALNCVTFYTNGTTVSYFVASTSYGLLASTKYAYIAVYSS